MSKTKSGLAVALAACFAAPSVVADPMTEMFDSIGSYGNVTGPGAYQSQGANVISGGSFYYRAPQKNITPVQIALPSVKFGCGGIDAQVGSFSFISGPELVQTLKNIGGSAVATFGFKLAMKAISPLIEGTLTDLQGISQALNATNINSCQASNALADGLGGNWSNTQQYFGSVAGPITGLFSDHAQAKNKTQGDPTEIKNVINATTDAKAKAQIKPGNLIWRALAGVTTLDYDQKRLLMSITGTVVYKPQPGEELDTPSPIAPKAIRIQSFIHGDGTAKKITVHSCDDGTGPDQCMDLGSADIDITPFKNQVSDRLTSIADKFKTNQKLSSTDIQFINLTNLPIYKALAVTTAKPNTGFDQVWIGTYSELIAAEYAFHYIVELTAQIKTALNQAKVGTLKTPTEDIEFLLTNAEAVKNDARASVTTAYAKVQSTNQIVNEIQQMERNLLSGLPANLAGNLRFGSSR